MRPPFLKGRRGFLILLLLSANLCLFLPPLRFIAALALICFLPGYFLAERLSLWKNPLFAAVGSVSLSMLISSLVPLPACWLFGRVQPSLIALSLDLFLFLILFSFKKEPEHDYPETDHHPLLGPLLVLIGLWVFIYMDYTKLGPFSEDWAYLFGITKELSRNMPPYDPEASFLYLKYPWGFYFIYGLIHRLSGISSWRVLEFIPVLIDFGFLGMVYMVIFQATRNKVSGLWAIIFMTVGTQSEWVFRGLWGYGWNPAFSFNLHWEEAQALTGYTVLWGWYILPSLLPPLTAFYFLIRYHQEKHHRDLYLSLAACAIGPYFHPVFYLGFLAGLSFFILSQWMKKIFDPKLFLYALTFIPYFLTFYLFFQPGRPDIPLYRFLIDPVSISRAWWDFLRVNGIVIPFALLALARSAEARTWFLPFSFLFSLLCLLGQGAINHTAHIMFQNRLYLSLLAAAGLGSLKQWPLILRGPLYLLILTVITLPFTFQVSHRAKTGWEMALDMEQKTAGRFIRSYTEENSLFLIYPDSRYALVCVEGLGERRLVWGWFYHLNRYVPQKTLEEYRERIRHFFSTRDPQFRKDFLACYRPDYIFLGPEELENLKKDPLGLETFFKGFRLVYQSRHIQILKNDSPSKP
ncbi:MAG: hypothetical protein AB1585_03670 [Thermodesulfobacteriota bacterium]